MTPDEAQQIRLGPLPRLASIAYTGKIWGGVQITDSFMRDLVDDFVLSFPDGGYDGLFSGVADAELLTVESLLTVDE